MISDRLSSEMNEQIVHEFHSAYTYLAIAAWCDEQNLEGSGRFFRVQAKEECEHAMKFFNVLAERGSRVILKAIAEPKVEIRSLQEAFEKGLAHEQFISRRIHTLMDIAVTEKDYASVSFLNWFVEEQVEEETSMERIVQQLKMIGDHKPSLLTMDARLGERKDED